jgi:hypothetical protein
MAVIINLKEVFATDSQTIISDKLNFNFNQLVALGIGQPGPIGSTGIVGPDGPQGPDGPAGPTGSVIFGLNAVIAPTVPPTPGTYPSSMVANDILITGEKILKFTGTGWLELTDFNSLVINALGSNISPYNRLTPTSRIVKSRITSGIDLTNSSTSTDPSYATPGLPTNYQTVLYNFNELNTRSVVYTSPAGIATPANSSTPVPFPAAAGSSPSTAGVDLANNLIIFTSAHGLSTGQYVTYSAESGTVIGGLTNFTGYYVLSSTSVAIQLCETAADVIANNPIVLTAVGSGLQKLITYPVTPDNIFPATANLSLYSYFNSTASPAQEFQTNPLSKGYRAQIELGSVDPLNTSYTAGVTGAAYVISPSFENLRMRKYRLAFATPFGDESAPGRYFLRAEYDLSSAGVSSITSESFSPRRNSEHVWKINKAESSHADGRTLEMKFTNSKILADTESGSSILIDGIFLKRGATTNGSPASYIGFGFEPSISAGQTKAKIVTGGVTIFEIATTDINLAATRVNALGTPLGSVSSNRFYISKNPSAGTNTVAEQSGYLLTFRSVSTSSDPLEGTSFGGITSQKNFNGTPAGAILANTIDLAGVVLEVDSGYVQGSTEVTRVAFNVSRGILGAERRAYINSVGSLIFDWDNAKTGGADRTVYIQPRQATNAGDVNGVTVRIQGGAGRAYVFDQTNGGHLSLNGGNGYSALFNIGSKGNVYLQSSTSNPGYYQQAYGVFVCAPEGATSPATLTVYPNTYSGETLGLNTESLRVLDDTLTPRFAMNNSGELTTGLRFPATIAASGNAYTLDRYAEGTWTPTVTGDTSHVTFTTGGQWTRIGSIIHLTGWIKWASGSTSNSAAELNHILIGNLPDSVGTSFLLNDARVGVWTEINHTDSLTEAQRFFGSGGNQIETGTIAHSYHTRVSGNTSFKLFFVGARTAGYNPLALNTANRTIMFNISYTVSRS